MEEAISGGTKKGLGRVNRGQEWRSKKKQKQVRCISCMDAGPFEFIRPGQKNGPPNPFRW